MRRAKSDWLLIAIGGLLGGFAGLVFSFVTMWADGPRMLEFDPVDYTIAYTSPPQPVVDARFDVQVLGFWHYSRTAVDHHEFDAEVDFLRCLNLIPGLLVIAWVSLSACKPAQCSDGGPNDGAPWFQPIERQLIV